jgi:16S rRNA (cytosine967-C5)-methyltransferase
MQDRAARLSLMRHTATVDRLRTVPWHALRADVALPAIASVLAGASAEREIDRALRRHRELARDERTATVEAIFGVALWRRRLLWHTGSASPANLLASLACDLGGFPDERVLSLTGATHTRAKTGLPARLADRWSLPDWLESHLMRELGDAAESFCAAIAVPGPICLRANRLRCTRSELVVSLASDGIDAVAGARAPDAVFVRTAQPNLFGTRAWRAGHFEP